MFWFTEAEFDSLIEDINSVFYFIGEVIMFLFEQITSSPLLSLAFFVPTGLVLIYLVYEFILWASDIHIKPDTDMVSFGFAELRRHKRNQFFEERNKKSEERFLANYEQRDNYYNAMLMNKAAQQKENEEYHNNLLAENKRYHDGILASKNSSSNKDVSFDLDKAKEVSRDRTRDIGNMKIRRKKSDIENSREENE